MTRALALLLTLSACATFPKVDAVALQPGLATPALLTADQLAALPGQTTTAAADPLAARAAALRARAALLRAR